MTPQSAPMTANQTANQTAPLDAARPLPHLTDALERYGLAALFCTLSALGARDDLDDGFSVGEIASDLESVSGIDGIHLDEMFCLDLIEADVIEFTDIIHSGKRGVTRLHHLCEDGLFRLAEFALWLEQTSRA